MGLLAVASANQEKRGAVAGYAASTQTPSTYASPSPAAALTYTKIQQPTVQKTLLTSAPQQQQQYYQQPLSYSSAPQQYQQQPIAYAQQPVKFAAPQKVSRKRNSN